MPGQDGTGPIGYGPRTGKGFGPCGGGRRRGFCRGFGRGYENQKPLTEAEEKKILETELENLDLTKQGIEKRLNEMK